MSLAEERARWGRRPFQFVEIEVDRCQLTYGQLPCTAAIGVTGERKCVNSWATCQDRQNFDPAPFFFRFADAAGDAPRRFSFADDGLDVFLPLLRRVEHSPGLPDPGESLGLRVELAVRLEDITHHDRGVDKYVDEREADVSDWLLAYGTWDDARVWRDLARWSDSGAALTGGAGPVAAGFYLRRLRARWPHYIGRRLRWYKGYLSDSPSSADFETRHYVVERWEGPDEAGRVRIVAKDPLKLADGERAQAPRASQGTLDADLAEGASPSTLDIQTPDDAEYDLAAGASEQWVRIGDEVIKYTGTSTISGGVRLTGLSREDMPAGYETARDDHDAGDLVQLCLLAEGKVTEVVRQLLEDYAGIDPAWIDATAWDAEHDTWLPGLTIRRLITEPEGVRDLVDEIVSETLTWAFWWDEAAQQIGYRAIRPPDTDEPVAALSDDANLVAGSIRLEDEPGRLANEVQMLYGQVDPAQSKTETGNYRAGKVAIDADSQSANEANQRRIKRVLSRWHPKTNGAQVEAWAARKLASLSANLVRVDFGLDPKDADLQTAEFADLTTLYIVDELGIPRTTRVQVIRAEAGGETMSVRARESFFRAQFGRWAPGELSGLTYADATSAQRERYLFWADAAGEMSDGSDGYGWG